ncbi:hypothetical protein [Allokutzneria sp. NRRL B-24872]|uniref:hypothetical protein n=1 Tax=Allokutzneria sp. NRRL B-24872 TaxID=1137961 RepID=UPI0011786E0E|nr:hypothetical protein [Allokutzneria sp. NRRL B-24872]
MLVAFLMTLYAGILSPLDSGVQSTDTVSTLAAETQQVQADPGRKPCGIEWPLCQPPNPKAIATDLTASMPASCGDVAWPGFCQPVGAQLAKDPGSVGGIEWPGTSGIVRVNGALPPLGPGVEWPDP